MTDRHRSAITGEFVTAKHAEANPDTTVSESPCTECERLRGVNHAQKIAIDGYREEVERLRAKQPIVRTVGDLTARHIGRRVRLDERYDGMLEAIFGYGGDLSLSFTHPEGFTYGCSRPLDTPCEVLP